MLESITQRHSLKIRRLVAVCAVALFAANHALAVVIIHDTGEAIPSAQYMAQLFAIDLDSPASKPAGLHLVSFPIRTTDMSPGVLTEKKSIKKPAWLIQPVFLIGSDHQSRTWLIANLPRLQQLNALGIVVDADSYEAFRALQQIAIGLALAPASADGLAQSLGLTVYPVLLQPDGGVDQ